jgi:RNA polymerase-binding transcription factor DksA
MTTTSATPSLDGQFLGRQADALRRERQAQSDLAAALLEEIRTLNDDTAVSDSTADDGFGEGTGSAVDQDRDRALHAQAMTRVEEIDAALRRIEAGTYGRCEVCGGAIGEARLEALPTATQCVACKAGGLASRHRAGTGRHAA